jgi:hypothetical protein
VVGVALAQGGEEVGDRRFADVTEVVEAAADEVFGVAPQVAPVGQQRVGRQAALDGEVVEVGPNDLRWRTPYAAGGPDRGGRLDRGQDRASASGVTGRSCASATGG